MSRQGRDRIARQLPASRCVGYAGRAQVIVTWVIMVMINSALSYLTGPLLCMAITAKRSPTGHRWGRVDLCGAFPSEGSTCGLSGASYF